jgi:hypothetical protein
MKVFIGACAVMHDARQRRLSTGDAVTDAVTQTLV